MNSFRLIIAIVLMVIPNLSFADHSHIFDVPEDVQESPLSEVDQGEEVEMEDAFLCNSQDCPSGLFCPAPQVFQNEVISSSVAFDVGVKSVPMASIRNVTVLNSGCNNPNCPRRLAAQAFSRSVPVIYSQPSSYVYLNRSTRMVTTDSFGRTWQSSSACNNPNCGNPNCPGPRGLIRRAVWKLRR